MSGKIFIRILLLFCMLISCLQSHISYSKVPARIKPRQNAWANGKNLPKILISINMELAVYLVNC